jgi:signal transduction histidine kinase
MVGVLGPQAHGVASPGRVAVIVQAGDAATARQLVTAAGGRITRDLPIVNGVGALLPPEFIGRLFEKFAQAERGMVRTGGGTGLGLAIVRELAHAQGGTAWFEPGRPTGATFCLRLPVANQRTIERMDHAALSGTAG